MSTNFTTDIGYGYILTFDQVRKIEENTMGEIWDYISCIDGYVDSCDYFFGVKLCSLYPGEYVNIAKIVELPFEEAEKVGNKIIAMLKDCSLDPAHPDWNDPQVYVLHRVT